MSEFGTHDLRDGMNPWTRRLLATLGLAGILIGVLAWAISSPAGASPDEDFHMGSIWCPTPLENSGCAYDPDGPTGPTIEIPETVYGAASCTKFNPWVDASCVDGLSDETMVRGSRFDDGAYPFGYFQFHHLLVGKDVEQSVFTMRAANILISLMAITLVISLSRPSMRRNAIIAALVAWVPMGIYYIASINPSSWSISGLFVFALGLLSASTSEGWRRWILMGASAFGASLVLMSRADASFYLLVVVIAGYVLVPFGKKRAPELIFGAIIALVGVVGMTTSGYASNMTSAADFPESEGMGPIQIFVANVLTIPEFTADFWGLTRGPGWLDTPILGWTSLVMLFVAGGVFLIGAENLYPRKVFAAIITMGGLIGIPVVALTLRNVAPLTYYQSRYLLPLLAVFLLVWLLRKDGETFFANGIQVWLIVALSSIANFFALRQVMLRYTIGIDENPLNGLVKFFGVEWWPWSIPPIVVLWGGSIAFALGLVSLLLAIPSTSINDVSLDGVQTRS